jgi:tetratricopeptide (TPR) repeat protein
VKKTRLLAFGLAALASHSALAQNAAQNAESSLLALMGGGFKTPTSEELRRRASGLDSLGLHHLALRERALIARAGRATPADLEEIGRTALVFDRLEVLTPIVNSAGGSIGGFPPSFRAALAALALRLGDANRAERYAPDVASLARIPEGAARNRALQILASIDVAQGRYTQAIEKFGAIGGRPADVAAARLQRARLYYDMARFPESLEELSNVQKNTAAWHPSVVVAAWSGYRVKDDNLALGQLMTLHSPYLATKFSPQTHLLEAAVLYRLCHYESAERSLGVLRRRYGKFRGFADRFRSTFGNRFGQVSAVLNYARGSREGLGEIAGEAEGRILLDGLLSDDGLLEVDRSLLQITVEDRALTRLTGQATGRVAEVARAYRAEFEAARREYYRKGLRSIQRRLATMSSETGEALEDAMAVEVEINTRVRERLLRRETARMKDVNFEAEIRKGYEFWPFEGEFWRDEVGGYAFATTDVCGNGQGG